MSDFELSYKNKKFLRFSTIFWLIIAVSFYFQDIITTRMSGAKNDLLFTAVFASGWVVWALITPYVVEIARKIPIYKSKILKGIFNYLLIGVIVSIVHLILEALLVLLIITLFFPARQIPATFPQYLVFQFHTHIIIFFLIAGVVQAAEYYKKFQKTEVQTLHLKNQLIDSQLRALKMQIHPHFLFNTHNSIISLMYKGETDKAIKMLTGLSDLLRITLQRENDHLITLKEELDFTSIYLDIQQVRFNNRLSIVKDFNGVDMNIKVPSFILQPIIENALEHGIGPYSDAGLLKLGIKEYNGILAISISDDGAGLTKKEFKEGIGLSNIRRRLKELYNENYEFIISNYLPQGTKVEIKIPVMYEQQ